MVEAIFVQYDDYVHRLQFSQMFREYSTWINNEVKKHYGVYIVPPAELLKVQESTILEIVAIEPPEGIIYIIEIEGKAAGMGRLTTLEKEIGEVNNVYIRSEYRRRGYSTDLMKRIEETAKEFGFSTLRLDTQKFNIPAQSLYRKIGYRENDRYTKMGKFENESLRKYYAEKVYMEKKL
jgi:ribosomal protein S18 acetylase RimI-like enzyme